ncbi:hypothetical protein AU194_15965 [Mycobacterium sp. GA-2829]|nr:hypothetical protein AU194_15965 [Mycobacterium sp. GA-2829]
MSTIFDDIERRDRSPALHTEDSFSFLNRVATPEWQRVRELVDAWYRDYPEASQTDLRGRFRDSDAAQHYGAWWELYVYTLFRRLGYDVAIHPALLTTTRQPDFLVSRGETAMYVECVVALTRMGTISGDGGGERSWGPCPHVVDTGFVVMRLRAA